MNNPAVQDVVSKANPFSIGFDPDVAPLWDEFLRVVMPVFGVHPTTINEITAKVVTTVVGIATSATQAISNGLTNIGMAVNEAVGNGPSFGPVLPLFYLPSDPFRISSPPVNNT